MASSKRTLKHIIQLLNTHLQTKEQKKYLRMAYRIHLNDKQQAQALGLWKRWMFAHAPLLAQEMAQDLKYLRDYFQKRQLEDYFDLKKYSGPSYLLWQPILIAIGGVMILFGYIGMGENGISLVVYNRFNMPSTNSGLYNFFLGTLVLVAGISSLNYALRPIRIHQKFKHLLK